MLLSLVIPLSILSWTTHSARRETVCDYPSLTRFSSDLLELSEWMERNFFRGVRVVPIVGSVKASKNVLKNFFSIHFWLCSWSRDQLVAHKWNHISNLLNTFHIVIAIKILQWIDKYPRWSPNWMSICDYTINHSSAGLQSMGRNVFAYR